MPGVIMENGGHGSHTNHERPRQNGATINGGLRFQDKPKQRSESEPQQNITPTSPTAPNGLPNGAFGGVQEGNGGIVVKAEPQAHMSELPEEIQHIAVGYVSLTKLFERMAVKTHHGLELKIQELAQMGVPSSVSVTLNASNKDSVDDLSAENIEKKKRWNDFFLESLNDWLKLRTISEWSRKAQDVSKCIDLKVHLDTQKWKFGSAIEKLGQYKKGFYQARLPNPDFKTALQVLSNGKVPWLPDIGYVEPPPLTSHGLLQSLTNLNTLLTTRLNMEEFDKVPPQFQDYSIKSGRVTFRVAGEFELDLTIADEDPEKQFWFIDFRFDFTPTIDEISAYHRSAIENKVNDVLSREGLVGCYKVLHEMVLTLKINEFKRQAQELAVGNWTGSLRPEPLNRSLSLAYWQERYKTGGKQSWIILGVHSGKRSDGRIDPNSTSRLFVRWFRDGQEVKDDKIIFDTSNLSIEGLLTTVIAEHINFVLASLHKRLLEKPLFAAGDATASLITSDEPSDARLRVELWNREHLDFTLNPVTGRVSLGPTTSLYAQLESVFYKDLKNPFDHGLDLIEQARCLTVMKEMTNHSWSMGWLLPFMRNNGPEVTDGGLKVVLSKNHSYFTWSRRSGWRRNWYLVFGFGFSGEKCWLLEAIPESQAPNAPAQRNKEPKLKIISRIEIPIKSATIEPSYPFFSTLNIFASALLSHNANMRDLYARKANYFLRKVTPSRSLTLPQIYVRFSEVSPAARHPWAKDSIQLTFEGLDIVSQTDNGLGPSVSSKPPAAGAMSSPTVAVPATIETTLVVTQARLLVKDPKSLSSMVVLNNLIDVVDRDIAFHRESGVFAFRLRSRAGESVIPTLIERVAKVERLVNFVEALHNFKDILTTIDISLGRIVFTYGSNLSKDGDRVVDPYEATINFDVTESPMTLNFNKKNPHIRIVDHLASLLNRGGGVGLTNVASLLPTTLPLLRAFDAIETSWDILSEKGQPVVMVRSADCYILRYNLNFPLDSLSPTIRKFSFTITKDYRRGVPWWHIKRHSHGHDPEPPDADKNLDEVDEALKPVWNSNAEGSLGMRSSAVARPDGVEALLRRVDEVMRTVELRIPEAPSQPQARPPAQRPVPGPPVHPQQGRMQGMVQQQQQQQQQHQRPQMRQQPTMGNGQSQGPGRNKGMGYNQRQTETIEID